MTFFGGYLTTAEIDAAMTRPGARRFVYGASWEGRELVAWQVGAAEYPCLLVIGGLHARELSPPEMLVRFAEHLAARLPEPVRVVLVPVANPDGRVIVETALPAAVAQRDGVVLLPTASPAWHRKNANGSEFPPRHVDGVDLAPGWTYNERHHGVDLSRNWPAEWAGGLELGGSSAQPSEATYRGPHRRSEPEVQALIALIDELSPAAIVSCHATDHETPNNMVICEVGSTKLATDLARRSDANVHQTSLGGTELAYAHSLGVPAAVLEFAGDGAGFWPRHEVLDRIWESCALPALLGAVRFVRLGAGCSPALHRRTLTDDGPAAMIS
jgi:Zinc carboxypeptidase